MGLIVRTLLQWLSSNVQI